MSSATQIIVLSMECNNYEDVIKALIQDNDGVLPDLSTMVTIKVPGDSSNLSASLPVGELLALTLAEIAANPTAPAPAEPESPRIKIEMPVLPSSGKPIRMATLLKRAVESVN